MSATYLDLTQLAANFQYASNNIEGEVQNYLENTGDAMANDMRAQAPKKTGYMASTIDVLKQQLRVTIGPHAYYSTFVEDGTKGPYVIKPVRANNLVFTINGRQVFAKKVIHPGNKPHPFIRPAALRYLDSLGEDVTNIGIKLIGGQQ